MTYRTNGTFHSQVSTSVMNARSPSSKVRNYVGISWCTRVKKPFNVRSKGAASASRWISIYVRTFGYIRVTSRTCVHSMVAAVALPSRPISSSTFLHMQRFVPINPSLFQLLPSLSQKFNLSTESHTHIFIHTLNK